MHDRFQIKVAIAPENPEPRFWESVDGYGLSCSTDEGGLPLEGAEVRFAWNGKGLYVHAELEDSFVVATSRSDEQLHFETGDVFEFFIKPLDDDYYWEMYATPFGNKSTLFFPRDRAGMTTDDFLKKHTFHGVEVYARTTERGWAADMFVPAAQLTALGADWCGATEWSVLCGRYNYNNDTLTNPELSMLPPVSKMNFHLTNEYARLVLQTEG